MSDSVQEIFSDPPEGLAALSALIGEDLRKLVRKYLVAQDSDVDVEDSVRRLLITLHLRLLHLTDEEREVVLGGGRNSGSDWPDAGRANLRRWLVIIATRMLATAASALRRYLPQQQASGLRFFRFFRSSSPAAPSSPSSGAPPGLPPSAARGVVAATIDGEVYRVRKYSRPADPVGGDNVVVCDDPSGDGTVWAIIGDVTSHGWPAWLLGAGLPFLWDLCLSGDRPATPSELLDSIDRRLEVCLPLGISVETTVARLCPSGVVTVAGSGPVIFRDDSESTLSVRRLGGPYLGWPPQLMEKGWRNGHGEFPWLQCRLQPGPHDEIVIASDGLFGQGFQGPLQGLLHAVPTLRRKRWMYDLLTASLDGDAFVPPQLDDLTFVSIQRLHEGDGFS